ncbi:MAG: hypothetical protein HYX47_06955 [Burkholderiales bacterium]|nr:hypothetical protein [Burkholderiales bacterium]
MSIFVSVASYCDPVLGFTLARAVALARRPDALHFGVVDQSPADWPRPQAGDLTPARLGYVRMDPVHARGPCWARAIAMSFYDGEDWFFQIDSHMDFEPHWDEVLVRQAELLQPGRAGAVITAYPNPFVFEGHTPVHKPCTPNVLAHVVKAAQQFDPEHLVLGFEAHPVDSALALPGFHLGAGCLFAPGAFAVRFPYDPGFYFHGEEQALALRLFTHGWDIFHMPGLPVWHLYNTADAGTPRRPLHWDEEVDSRRGQNWWSLEQRSRRRLGELVRGAPLGVYGLGQARSLADYAAFSGIDYMARTLAAGAYVPPSAVPAPAA